MSSFLLLGTALMAVQCPYHSHRMPMDAGVVVFYYTFQLLSPCLGITTTTLRVPHLYYNHCMLSPSPEILVYRVILCLGLEMLGMSNDLITWLFVDSIRPYTLLLKRCWCWWWWCSDWCCCCPAFSGGWWAIAWVAADSGPGFGPVLVVVRIKSRKLLCDPVVKRCWWYCE